MFWSPCLLGATIHALLSTVQWAHTYVTYMTQRPSTAVRLDQRIATGLITAPFTEDNHKAGATRM